MESLGICFLLLVGFLAGKFLTFQALGIITAIGLITVIIVWSKFNKEAEKIISLVVTACALVVLLPAWITYAISSNSSFFSDISNYLFR